MVTRLYKTLFSLILKCSNVDWGSHYLVDQKQIKAIQCRVNKLRNYINIRHQLHQQTYGIAASFTMTQVPM